jgi:hypothetical protein
MNLGFFAQNRMFCGLRRVYTIWYRRSIEPVPHRRRDGGYDEDADDCNLASSEWMRAKQAKNANVIQYPQTIRP